MNAQQARDLTNSKNNFTFQHALQHITDLIKAAANRGDNSIRWNIPNTFEPQAKKLISHLVGLGYTVKRERGSDQRDGDFWDYLTIEW